MSTFLDFEAGLADLEGKIEELRRLKDKDKTLNIDDDINRLQHKVEKQLRQIYDKLTPWQKVQVARHGNRPRFSHYAKQLFEDFTPLAGDRSFGEDAAIIGGLARFNGQNVVVIGQERGHDTVSRVKHNFGMPKPEGYRKAQRLMKLAEHFRLPLLTFIDTPGAYPGVGAEERGQAEAIARSIETCFSLSVPFIATVIGEGGSGGAIAIAAADRVLMLEHAIYSVISPEGCASILWRSATNAPDAAEALKITAQDLLKLKVIDAIIKEPLGGAHRDAYHTIETVRQSLIAHLESLRVMPDAERRARRQEKFLSIGEQLIAA